MDPTRFHQQFAEDLRHQVNNVSSTFKIDILAGIISLLDATGTLWDGRGQLGRSLKGFLCILPDQLRCRSPHFYRFVTCLPPMSTSSLSSPSLQGSTWEVLGGDIPSTTPSHSKDKARSVSIH